MPPATRPVPAWLADTVGGRPVLVTDGDRVEALVTARDLERVAGRRVGAVGSHR